MYFISSIAYFVGLAIISASIADLSMKNSFGFLTLGIGTMCYAVILAACKAEE